MKGNSDNNNSITDISKPNNLHIPKKQNKDTQIRESNGKRGIKQKKNVSLTIRVTPNEKKAIEKKYKNHGYKSFSSYARDNLLHSKTNRTASLDKNTAYQYHTQNELINNIYDLTINAGQFVSTETIIDLINAYDKEIKRHVQ